MGEDKQKTEALATKAKEGTLQAYLEAPAYKKRFNELLGQRAPQFMSSIVSIANSSALLAKAEPRSLIAAGMIAATLDLPIDKNLGFAWIVPYNDKKNSVTLAQFQMGYKGYVQLALRSGQYSGMNAFKVNQSAFVGYDEIGDPVIDFELLDETAPDIIGYAFAWKLINGFHKIVFWSKDKCKHHAETYSQSHMSHIRYGKAEGWDCRWCKDFDAMALKTVVGMAIRKWGIMRIEMSENMNRAINYDQSASIDIEAAPIYPDAVDGELAEDPESAPPSPTNGRDRADELAARLAAKNAAPEAGAVASKPQEPTATETSSEPTGTATGPRERLAEAFMICGEARGNKVANETLELAAKTRKIDKVKDEDIEGAIAALMKASRE